RNQEPEAQHAAPQATASQQSTEPSIPPPETAGHSVTTARVPPPAADADLINPATIEADRRAAGLPARITESWQRVEEPPAPSETQEQRSDYHRPMLVQKNDPKLVEAIIKAGNTAFRRDDMEGARRSYTEILNRHNDHRGALLGLAAVAVRTHQDNRAAEIYLSLLKRNPRDLQAMTGLINQQASSEPRHFETRLKTLLRDHPDSGPLQFSLGTVYASQSRWKAAQQAFFQAYVKDPDNANILFNLAVSLDRLGQSDAALPYYQRALSNASGQPILFDPLQIRQRIVDLTMPPVPDRLSSPRTQPGALP
ncbi:MAG: tetratricopeptide repeat protein, partial [Magnetococcales bacterium]|nr:tetratricopeptide repeat protein [Magnetococcales bacterium]